MLSSAYPSASHTCLAYDSILKKLAPLRSSPLLGCFHVCNHGCGQPIVDAGKILLLGGQGRREGTASEVWHLDLSTMVWEQAQSARMHWQTVQASCATMGTSKARSVRHQYSICPVPPYMYHGTVMNILTDYLVHGVNAWFVVREVVLLESVVIDVLLSPPASLGFAQCWRLPSPRHGCTQVSSQGRLRSVSSACRQHRK